MEEENPKGLAVSDPVKAWRRSGGSAGVPFLGDATLASRVGHVRAVRGFVLYHALMRKVVQMIQAFCSMLTPDKGVQMVLVFLGSILACILSLESRMLRFSPCLGSQRRRSQQPARRDTMGLNRGWEVVCDVQVGINLSVKWMKNPLQVSEAGFCSC